MGPSSPTRKTDSAMKMCLAAVASQLEPTGQSEKRLPQGGLLATTFKDCMAGSRLPSATKRQAGRFREARTHDGTHPMYADWQVEKMHVVGLQFQRRETLVIRMYSVLSGRSTGRRNVTEIGRKYTTTTVPIRPQQAARKAKEAVYEAKSLVVTLLLRLGRIALVGNTDDEPVFAVFRGEGYCFDCPVGMWTSEVNVPFDGKVEAKPKTSREMRLRDAWATINGFLSRNPPTPQDEDFAHASKLPARVKDYSFGHWRDYEGDEGLLGRRRRIR